MTEILLYKTANEEIKLEVLIQNETIWLNQKQISELFDVKVPAISKHLKNIFISGELDEKVVVSKMEITTKHGAIEGKQQTKKVNFYNLDAIISIGYRVNSQKATQFRIWATKILQEYIIKGFAMDDERLKNPDQPFGKDYFDEQLERIRDVRSSERRFYQKITDIYAQCSADYDSNSKETKNFYATVQNKLHFSMVGQTASEIIYDRVDSKKQNMGLTNWKNSPQGKIRKADVSIAKNYLEVDELNLYNRIVTMYLDFAEFQAESKNIMYQKDWIEKLNKFLTFNEREILQDNGSITAKLAKELAENEFDKYKSIQDEKYLSDFDNLILELEKR
jgi:hypothetical protein